ncbi:hypothetical protein LTSEMON_0235 [Salmonella enterica subsp. enterica serovar Montevideo str. S5-403]|uniref:Uncharacterized protein n=1 Tax=Salmonella enterica subsp. enterica serovar Montevideo str. S5-403 TaxID=913242 RepID=G5PXZ1_SALMO|nr:hypothetical protein LTSEMON_0235 [Salmonella enterica subsp. enterica serovar Montevideo str. S5-403]
MSQAALNTRNSDEETPSSRRNNLRTTAMTRQEFYSC